MLPVSERNVCCRTDLLICDPRTKVLLREAFDVHGLTKRHCPLRRRRSRRTLGALSVASTKMFCVAATPRRHWPCELHMNVFLRPTVSGRVYAAAIVWLWCANDVKPTIRDLIGVGSYLSTAQRHSG